MKRLTGAGDLTLFIFDLDGTLVRFAVDWGEVKARIRTLLGTDEPLSPLIPSIERLATDPRLRSRIYGLVDDAEMAAARGFHPDAEIVELFRRLVSLGPRIALVTLQGRRPAVEALTRVGLLGFFDLITSRDDVKTRKEQIAATLERLTISPGQAIVIADKQADMAAAKNLGCLTFAVTDRPEVTGDFKAARAVELLQVLGLEGA